jgi:hypothetical protein
VALELFTGCSWRRHDDIDIGICRIDAPAVYSWLTDLDPYVAAGGRLRRWEGEPLLAGRMENNIWVRRPAAGPFLFDIAVGDGDDSGWVYRRDARIRRPWTQTLLKTLCDVPYLAPELQLLFKSKGRRPKDDRDAEMVIPLMSNDRQTWLREWLPPDHSWRGLFASVSAASNSPGNDGTLRPGRSHGS